MNVTPKLPDKKLTDMIQENAPKELSKEEMLAILKNIHAGLQALTESFATAEISVVSAIKTMQTDPSKDTDMDIRTLYEQLGEMYETIDDLCGIMDEFGLDDDELCRGYTE